MAGGLIFSGKVQGQVADEALYFCCLLFVKRVAK
jgi:hypothetical protein